MADKKSAHPLYDDLLGMLKSENEASAAKATDLFAGMGALAARTLLDEARGRRFAPRHRVRFLRVAGKIGMRYENYDYRILQRLIEDKSSEVAEEAIRLLNQIHPGGACPALALPMLTGLPHCFKGDEKPRRRAKRRPK